MRISDIFQQKKAVFSFEIFPPKPTADVAAVRGTIEELSALGPDYISVTCSAGGSGNARTAEIAALVRSCGVEPLAHVTCINSDREAVSATLRELDSLGIRNVLALRGDRVQAPPRAGTFPTPPTSLHSSARADSISTSRARATPKAIPRAPTCSRTSAT